MGKIYCWYAEGGGFDSPFSWLRATQHVAAVTIVPSGSVPVGSWSWISVVVVGGSCLGGSFPVESRLGGQLSSVVVVQSGVFPSDSCPGWRSKVTGVTFSDPSSSLLLKFLNPIRGLEYFLISKCDSCSNSGYYRSNRKFPIFSPKITTQTPATAEIEMWLRIRFFLEIFDTESRFRFERKVQNQAGVDSGTLVP